MGRGVVKLSVAKSGPVRASPRILGEGAMANLISNQLFLGRQREVARLYCALCTREAAYSTVFKHGSTYCSVECVQAVPGLYLG